MSEEYKKFVNDLFNGLASLFPQSFFKEAYNPRKHPVQEPFVDSSGRIWTPEKFGVYVMNWTGKNNTDEASDTVKRWKAALEEEGQPEPDMPPEEILREAEKEADLEPTQEGKTKKILLFSQRYIESIHPKTEVDVNEFPTEGILKLSPQVVSSLEHAVSKGTTFSLNIASFFSPPPIQKTITPVIGGSISLAQFEQKIKRSKDLTERDKLKLLDFIRILKTAEFSFATKATLASKIYPVAGINLMTSVEFQQLKIPPTFPVNENQLVAVVQPSGEKPSLATSVAKTVTGGLIKRTISRTVTTATTQAISMATGTAIAPGVGTAIGLVVGWLVGKAKNLLSWIKRNLGDFLIGLGGLLGLGGVALGGTSFSVIAPLFLITGGISAGLGFVRNSGGIQPALSKAGGFTHSVGSAVFGAAIVSISTPVIITLAAFPVIVVLILFVINSGAYLVPPKGEILPGFVESPYIKVAKRPNPPGPFQNSQLPLDNITYTISISALKGALTNIKFEYGCSVYKKSGSISCPTVSIKDSEGKEISLGSQENLVISPANSYTLTYTSSYDTSFSDSAIVDSFTVTADTPDQANAVSSGRASVIIGKPSLGCFTFNETVGSYLDLGVYSLGWNKYPARRQKVMHSIVTLSLSSSWLDYVCRSGEVVLTHARQEGPWGAWAPSATTSDIIFYSTHGITEGSGSEYDLYLFAHESGHLIDYRNSVAQSQYRELAAFEGYLPTYPSCCRSEAEDLAESIGRFPINHSILEESRFQGHKEFAKFIFGIDF